MARLHVFALAHTVSNKKYGLCAYTGKVQRFCKMMSERGHEVIHYGNEGSDDLGELTEHVEVFSVEDQDRLFGGQEWYEKKIWHAAPLSGHHVNLWNNKAVRRARKRIVGRPDEFLCLIMGRGQESIAHALNGTAAVEFGVGYEGVFTQRRCFESYAWMHHVYGLQAQRTGIWYDAVVPNYFDPGDFEFRAKKSDYFLFLGRMTHQKGYQIAVDVTRELGAKLVIAGAPGEKPSKDDHVEYAGIADVAKRRELLAGAKALFVPTHYLEPFGGVVVEAGFSGTPVITSDWGAFPETVAHGITGFRCRSFKQFLNAAMHVDQISPERCLENAQIYTMGNVAPLYEQYFDMISSPSWYAGITR